MRIKFALSQKRAKILKMTNFAFEQGLKFVKNKENKN